MTRGISGFLGRFLDKLQNRRWRGTIGAGIAGQAGSDDFRGEGTADARDARFHHDLVHSRGDTAEALFSTAIFDAFFHKDAFAAAGEKQPHHFKVSIGFGDGIRVDVEPFRQLTD